ncbi:putative transcription factor AP2-EREBP family [Rosa chinensis]|uniref:Putative transcription factor AP2-EREBP family n=1 Tax=Rosa chinensis TaxID=74649 RepID=A0A2P6SE82_ROSCH|nr:putative transcription factor AP2-EREBP family [Rosa chinensis]
MDFYNQWIASFLCGRLRRIERFLLHLLHWLGYSLKKEGARFFIWVVMTIDKEDKAARAYDLAALKYWGTSPATTTNFPMSAYMIYSGISSYENKIDEMKPMTRQEYVPSLRRKETPHHSYNLDNHMHQFKGSSASIRTKKVKAECQQFREYCRAGNREWLLFGTAHERIRG